MEDGKKGGMKTSLGGTLVSGLCGVVLMSACSGFPADDVPEPAVGSVSAAIADALPGAPFDQVAVLTDVYGVICGGRELPDDLADLPLTPEQLAQLASVAADPDSTGAILSGEVGGNTAGTESGAAGADDALTVEDVVKLCGVDPAASQ